MVLPLLIWLAAAAFLVAGTMVLRQGLRIYAAERAISHRFHANLVPRAGSVRHATFISGLLERLGRKASGDAPTRDVQNLLQQAGFPGAAAPFILAGTRLVAVVGAVFLAVGIPYLRHGTIRPLDGAIACFAGFVVYRGFAVGLKMRVQTRQREIRRELPYVLDLVLMVLDSGVSIDQALQHVSGQIGRAAPVIAPLMQRYLADTEDGVPYDQALDRLAQRLAISEGRDFAALLKQNLFQGGELGPPLRRLAVDVGDARLATAREQLGRKSVLLTLVMLAFFMPVLMIALAGPAVSDIVGTLGHVAHDLQNSRNR